jgi:intracellular septation protein
VKLLVDLFPVILFFVAFKIKGIFVATAVAIVASVAQVGWMYFAKKRVEPAALIGLVVIVVFGGLTILLKNETFIKWKPSVLYTLFALILLVGQVGFGRNFMQVLLGAQMPLPRVVWDRLNVAWMAFFAALAGANLYVAYHFPTAAWVNFKLFGIMGLIFLFVIGQSVVLAPYLKDQKEPQSAPPQV